MEFQSLDAMLSKNKITEKIKRKPGHVATPDWLIPVKKWNKSWPLDLSDDGRTRLTHTGSFK